MYSSTFTTTSIYPIHRENTSMTVSRTNIQLTFLTGRSLIFYPIYINFVSYAWWEAVSLSGVDVGNKQF